MKRLHFFLILLTLFSTTLNAQDTSRFQRRVFRTAEGELNYRLLPPLGYQKGQKYPLVVFLHGSGERGSDNGRQLIWGGKRFADSIQRTKYKAWVIFPQCPKDRRWSGYVEVQKEAEGSPRKLAFPITDTGTMAQRLVFGLIDSMLATGAVDAKRVYLGGLSMGAMGTFDMLWRRPRFFAAALAICGGGDPQVVKTYAKGFPIWVFHGDRDRSVNVGYSRRLVEELKKGKAKVRYTEYWWVGHNSWDNAFAEPDLLDWLFAQKRK